jgi:hypothetical protein
MTEPMRVHYRQCSDRQPSDAGWTDRCICDEIRGKSKWSVTVPGQPVSWDAAYKTMRRPVVGRKGPVLNADGSQKMIHRPGKTDEAAEYQRGAQLVIQAAAPSGWSPPGQVRMVVDLYLSHDMDDDNAMKLLRDTVQKATGVDDMRFLACTRRKEIVSANDARIVLTFEDL